jgi:ATP-dependent Clp protease ATP-binding subunit ClpB
MFQPLSREEIKKIAFLILKKSKKNLAKSEMGLEFSDSAMNLIAELGYDPQFGARPLKRVIQKEITNELSKQVLSGEFTTGDTIYVGTDAKGFTFTEKPTDSKTAPKVEKKEKSSKADKLQKAADDVKKAVDDIKEADKKDGK